MAYTVAIIGSFQSYYNDILNVIKYFVDSGLYVLSPKESFICDKKKGFVFFDSDPPNYTPEEIQMITLNKIINADFVYVYNRDGYVGKTTCYEIGFCFSKKKPLFFYEIPDDLPIPIHAEKQVLKPKEFVDRISNEKPEFITDYKMCEESQKAFSHLFNIEKKVGLYKTKKIVICGSMMFFDEMGKIRQKLDSMGIQAIIPQDENEVVKYFNETQFMKFKRDVSRTYLRKIRAKNTIGVLIYNAEKNGIPNYIGANTLVELAMAFTWNRKIFLYNDIYMPLKDELQAWECISLKGDLDKLKSELDNNFCNDETNENVQPTLFDV